MDRKFDGPPAPYNDRKTSVLRTLLLSSPLLVFLAGCASYGKIENSRLTETQTDTEYSMKNFSRMGNDQDLSLILTFSGGGTRASAMAYGVMQELRDTQVVIKGKSRRLLDEVDTISSVSGGSFTSAYYGLHGDGLFDSFEEVFLRYNIEKGLAYRLLNPILWFSKKGRTHGH